MATAKRQPQKRKSVANNGSAAPAKRGPGRPRKNPLPGSSSSSDANSVIRSYLKSIGTPQPRGRKMDVSTLRSRLSATADPMDRLLLTQRLLDATSNGALNRKELESAFIATASKWGSEHRVSWSAWRQLGVPAPVLRRAGIKE